MLNENAQNHHSVNPWLDPYKWKPGESANPGGKPGRPLDSVSLTGAIKAKFREEGPEALLKAIDQLIKEGNVAMLTEIWNRLDGKVSDKVELRGTLLVGTPDQLDYAFNQIAEAQNRVRLVAGGVGEDAIK